MPAEDPEDDKPVTVTSCALEQVNTRTICVDFEANLSARDKAPLSVPVPDVPLSGQWSLVVVGFELLVKKTDFRVAEHASAGAFSLAKHRRYRVVLELKEKQPHLPHASQKLAVRNRSIAIGSKRRRKSSSRGAEPPTSKDFEDSDDEMDERLFENELPTLFSAEDGVDFTYRQITVTQTAYSTSRAVLRYLATGNVSAIRTRRGCIDHLSPTGINPSALLVSPKSVYRLAHLLQLEDLHQAALAAFKGSLTPANAAAELFDNALVLYDEWRNVALAFVVHHFDEINEAPSWIEMMERIERDEVPGAAGILVKLVRAQTG
ncbi:hypothetical protein JCM10449v2_004852 [Rhodotorula kratochvilovae]